MKKEKRNTYRCGQRTVRLAGCGMQPSSLRAQAQLMRTETCGLLRIREREKAERRNDRGARADRQFENRLKIGLKKCKANFVKFYVNGVSPALGTPQCGGKVLCYPLSCSSPPGGATTYQILHLSINRQVANLTPSPTFRYVFSLNLHYNITDDANKECSSSIPNGCPYHHTRFWTHMMISNTSRLGIFPNATRHKYVHGNVAHRTGTHLKRRRSITPVCSFVIVHTPLVSPSVSKLQPQGGCNNGSRDGNRCCSKLCVELSVFILVIQTNPLPNLKSVM
ncbi:hypothetical protein TNCV_1472721 [Trichonephila clavipes]|nr:hypothetical protein TNCV_1472721 [Trichonephila clavipes]